jgi:CDP-diacylglycerol--serine O-phosphatidyltransferase
MWWRRLAPGASINIVLPNLITLLSLCSGMTAIKMAFESRFELGALAILIAICLDAMDGRVARLVNGTSKFGVELDSLADAINFGVAPGVLLHCFTLHQLGPLGWGAALLFAAFIVLRLARFNVTATPQQTDYFCGMPAPAAAAIAMLPLYLSLAGIWQAPAFLVAAYLLGIGILAISTVPFYSGKISGARLAQNSRFVLVLSLAGLAAIAASSFWLSMTSAVLAYLIIVSAGIMQHAYDSHITKH